MRPFDDDLSVTDARDEGVIAGRAVASQDAALAEVAAELRAAARADVPEPSAELAMLLAHGTAGATAVLDAPDDAAEADLAEVVPLARRRRRVLRYVVGGSVAAALALGGTAAAAAVRDGVPVAELPGAIGDRIAGAVSDALESVGVRHPDAPARPGRRPGGPRCGLAGPGSRPRRTRVRAPPTRHPASSRAARVRECPTRLRVASPAARVRAPPTRHPASSRAARVRASSDQAPGRDGSGAGSSDEAPGHQDGAPGSSEQPSQDPGDSGGGQGTDAGAGTAGSAGTSGTAHG